MVEPPSIDPPRLENIEFFVQHDFCFRPAFSGNCDKPSCSFNHDTIIVLAGHFRDPTSSQKRRNTNQRRDDTSFLPPKPKLYALSDKMVVMLAAVMEEKLDLADLEGYDTRRYAP